MRQRSIKFLRVLRRALTNHVSLLRYKSEILKNSSYLQIGGMTNYKGSQTFSRILRNGALWNLLMTHGPVRAVSAALHTTPIGGGHAVTGDQNSVPSPLSPKRMLRSPKLKYEALEINEIRGPFERKVLMLYSYFGVLWEQGIYTLHCCWGPLWKQSSLLMHYSCCWAPLKARNFTHYSCKGGPEASASLFSLKHTTVYNPDNGLIWEYETDWTRSASSDYPTFSPDVRT